MTFADDMKAVLVADSGAGGANTLLTGGVYTFGELGENGINLQDTPNAFNGTLLKPCCVLKDRAQVPDRGVMDAGLQIMSYRQVVEVWLYNNRSAGFATLDTIWRRIYVLLHEQAVGADSQTARWVGNSVSNKEPELENAVFTRNDFEFRDLMTAS